MVTSLWVCLFFISGLSLKYIYRFLISQCGLDFVRQHSGSGDDDENLSNLASSRLALEAHADANGYHSRRPRQRDSQRFGQEETARIVCKYNIILWDAINNFKSSHFIIFAI